MRRDLLGLTRFLLARLAWTLRIGAVAAAGAGQWISALVLLALTPAFEEVVGLYDRLPWRARRLPIVKLLTLPAPETPFPCRIEVRKGVTLLGLDEGVVTFIEGWLVYEGLRTSFSIRRTDVFKRFDDRLELAEGGTLVFTPQDRLTFGEHIETDLTKRFRANLASWMRSDAPIGESILPPSRPHASGFVRAQGHLTTAVLLGTLITWALAAHFSSTWAAWAGLSFAFGFMIAARDLYRIRRLTRSALPLATVE